MKMTDFHTHSFPDQLAPRAIASLEKSSGGKAFLDGTVGALKESMKQAGISLSVLLPIAVKPKQTPTINTVAILNDHDPCFVSFGSVHPDYKDWKGELMRIKKAGLKGIKLHPDFQEMFLDDPKMVEVMRTAADMGLLITIHGGMDVSYPDLHRSTPERLARILPELKGARIICAHSGGFRYLDEVEELLLGHEEIYIDTSFSIGQQGMDTKQLERIYRNIDPTHILFGTDSPWDGQKQAVEAFMALDIPDKVRQAALCDNAQRLLG